MAYLTDPEGVQSALYAISLTTAVLRGSVDTRIALFVRDEDFERTILLLSPDAAAYADRLPGTWEDAKDIEQYGWALLYSNGASWDDFGLKRPDPFR